MSWVTEEEYQAAKPVSYTHLILTYINPLWDDSPNKFMVHFTSTFLIWGSRITIKYL